MKNYNAIDLQALDAIASTLAAQLRVGDVITLSGDLGSGKTTFTSLLMKYLSTETIQVTSPTFNIVNVY
ncbi:MAG: tRNA (adenosine(37)-N6)-threonylcarbamoyltransferase complex ATPase subunit type 1 TsaE, partial [Gammaproteobacteria bacterium]